MLAGSCNVKKNVNEESRAHVNCAAKCADTGIAESMQTRIVILHRLTEGMSSTFDQENQGNLDSDLS